jgi:hypothetical protein
MIEQYLPNNNETATAPKILPTKQPLGLKRFRSLAQLHGTPCRSILRIPSRFRLEISLDLPRLVFGSGHVDFVLPVVSNSNCAALHCIAFQNQGIRLLARCRGREGDAPSFGKCVHLYERDIRPKKNNVFLFLPSFAKLSKSST